MALMPSARYCSGEKNIIQAEGFASKFVACGDEDPASVVLLTVTMYQIQTLSSCSTINPWMETAVLEVTLDNEHICIPGWEEGNLL